MWGLIVSVPDHCLSFYLIWILRFFLIQISTVQYCLKKQSIFIALLILRNIINNHKTSSSRKKSNIFYVLKC